jgi:CelD/BcsL family acetyltransferase involved in cellulose biosynthesis
MTDDGVGMPVPVRVPTKCDVLRPSELGTAETATWRAIMAQSPIMQRAFFSPAFALACERAGWRVHVAVLSDGSGVCGFLPFQFKSFWHERCRLAERVGGNLSQGASLVAWPGVRLDSRSLLRFCGLSVMHVIQLMEGQDLFGLDAVWSRVGHMIDIHTGPTAYFDAMAERNRNFVRDTERRLRRAEKTFGPLQYVRYDKVPPRMISDLIQMKRLQYQRTQAADPFTRRECLSLIEALNEEPVPECRLILTRLEAGGRVLAHHLGPQHHGVLSYWFQVYDSEARDVSPGRLLLWNTIQRAAEDGIQLIDRGEGDVQHKRDLATGSLRYGRANWSDRSGRALVARAWQSLEWRVQDWRHPVPAAATQRT